jgi:hypothetical protein
MQLADGAWPWFPGGPGNDYITLYITTGFGRLRHLKADVSVEPALRSLNRLDGWMHEHYQRIQRWSEPDKYVPSSTDALYLYGRSFFLDDQPVNPQHKPALEFFLAQARKHWLQTNSRQTQGHLALALHRFAKARGTPDPTPMAIMASLKERSVSNEEMGRFWRDLELSWWWYHAPIETQALMIEAFDEVAHDPQAVEDCRVWLLKQKQTQDWKTTKATADAVYALLLRGRDLLSSDALVELKLGGIDLTPGKRRPTKAGAAAPPVEAGTGFYEVRFPGPEVKPKMGEIMVRKADPGVAWGSVHWQYLEEMTKVTPYAGTPLKLRKLCMSKPTPTAAVIEPVRGPLRVGDELGRAPPSCGRTATWNTFTSRTSAAAAPNRSTGCPGTATRTAWPITRPPATPPAISSLITSRRAFTCSNTRPASRCAASTSPAWPKSSACMPPSSTRTPRACR